MSHRTLIVARMRPDSETSVAGLFAESDAGSLPIQLGVQRRSLFSFHGLYFHLIEADDDIAAGVAQVRDRPEFAELNRKLAAYIAAYAPATWRSPADAMATQFYTWQRDSA
jgi:cyclase